MPFVEDQSGTTIQDQSGAGIEDQGGGALVVQSAYHSIDSEVAEAYSGNTLTVQTAFHDVSGEVVLIWMPQETYHAVSSDVIEIGFGVTSLTAQSTNHSISNGVPTVGALRTLAVQGANHDHAGENMQVGSWRLTVQQAYHTLTADDVTVSSQNHNNTEHYTYNTDDYLRCSHSGGVLTGTYTSNVFDIGAGNAGRYLVYILADVVVTGTGTRWTDKFPSPTTWAEGNAASKTWTEIFELPEGPAVAMSLYHGTSDPPTNEVKKMEILSTIVPDNSRYFQVEITITDPNINVYALVENYELKFCS